MSGNDARIIDTVAANSPSHTPWIGFFGSESRDHAKVSSFTAFRDGRFGNEEDGVSSFDVGMIGAETLGETSDFFSVGSLPQMALATPS